MTSSETASTGAVPRVTRFSVYIPVWNEARWLPGAIESVLAQTHPDWELIIGDNASEDDLGAIAARHPDPRIRYVRWDRHVPMSENHNRTMMLGRYEWLHVLSADDRMRPDALAVIAARVQADDGRSPLAMIVGACRRVDEGGQATDLVDGRIGRAEIYQQMADGRYDAERWVRSNATPGIRPWMAGAVSMPRELVHEIGGWRPEMGLCHDLEFLLRIAAFGDVEYIDSPLLDYTVRADSVTTILSNRHVRRGDPMVLQGRAWHSILLAHAARRSISSAEHREVDAAIARAFLQRAMWHRWMIGGRGRPGAAQDIWRAFRLSPRIALTPRNVAAATVAVLVPRRGIDAIRSRAHRRGKVLI